MTSKPSGLPPVVHVGARIYTIIVDKPAITTAAVEMRSELYGVTDNDQMRILIHPDSNIDRKRESLVHEILHTLTNVTGVDKDLDGDSEEKIVNRMAPALLDVLRRNPKLVVYLTAP